MHYALGGLSIVLTITIASNLPFIKDDADLISVLAWVAAISVGLTTFIRPAERAKVYREAWLELHLARSKYLHDDSFTLQNLEKAFENGWSDIVKLSDKLSKQSTQGNV